LTSLSASVILVTLVPNFLNKNDYGYWQLFLLYNTYIGLFSLGWNDGIFLRYGGKEYKLLNKEVLFSQFWMSVILQIIMTVLAMVTLPLIIKTYFIIYAVAVGITKTNIRNMLLFILEATMRDREYAVSIIMDRILFIGIILIIILSGKSDYRYFISAELISGFAAMFYLVYCCKDIVFSASKRFFDFKEAYQNIGCGFKLLLSNLINILITGIVRIVIKGRWDITVFGNISLVLSVSNIIMVFVNSASIVIFPLLRRINKNQLPGLYYSIRNIIMIILVGMLLMYYPLKLLLSIVLPQYKEALDYMAVLIPAYIFEGNIGLLGNTYLKTMKKERILLKINIVTLILCGLINLYTAYVMGDLLLTVLSIYLVLTFRSIITEMYLSKELMISIKKKILLELLQTIVFIYTSLFLPLFVSFLITLSAYLLYILFNKKDIIAAVKYMHHYYKN
jgi:O-antigen/teichoic acid export membrane protein